MNPAKYSCDQGLIDEKLTKAKLAGTEQQRDEALEEIYRAFRLPVYFFLAQIHPRAEDLEALVQDTFVEVCQKSSTYDPLKNPGKLISWICGIAKNISKNDWRRNIKRRNRERRWGQENSDPIPVETIYAGIVYVEYKRLLAEKIATLPESLQGLATILLLQPGNKLRRKELREWLARLEQKDPREISDAMIASKMRRIRKAIRPWLSELLPNNILTKANKGDKS